MRLERQLAAIRAAGDPLTLADLKPKPIPPEKNAATYLRQAEADVDAIVNKINGIDVGSHIKGNNHSYIYPMPPKVRKIIKAVVRRPSRCDTDSGARRLPAPITIRSWTTRFPIRRY